MRRPACHLIRKAAAKTAPFPTSLLSRVSPESQTTWRYNTATGGAQGGAYPAAARCVSVKRAPRDRRPFHIADSGQVNVLSGAAPSTTTKGKLGHRLAPLDGGERVSPRVRPSDDSDATRRAGGDTLRRARTVAPPQRYGREAALDALVVICFKHDRGSSVARVPPPVLRRNPKAAAASASLATTTNRRRWAFSHPSALMPRLGLCAETPVILATSFRFAISVSLSFTYRRS